MAPNAAPGETNKRDLATDDINGFNHLYENSGNGNSGNNGSGNSGSNGSNGSGGGGGIGQNGNSSGQTGQGMVPLDNASCSSMNNGPASLLGSLFILLGIGRRKTRS